MSDVCVMKRISKYLWLANLFLGVTLITLVSMAFYEKGSAQMYCSISEEEILNIAIECTLQEYPPHIEFSDGHLYKPALPIHYQDVADFKSKNSNCCSIRYELPYVSYHFDKGYGSYLSVSLDFNVFYLDGNGAVKSKPTNNYQYISSCGVPGTFSRG